MTGVFGIGVHALTYLNHKQCSLNSEQLAENICTNPARVRKIMAKLRQAGLVETREGGGGGYQFTLAPESVTLRQVADAVEARFVSGGKASGDPDMDCQIASGIGAVLDEIYLDLDGICRKKMELLTILDIDRRIFQNAEKG